jgi:L-ascorbate metabolism protein UlaG (beta-lactamase superfamily)
VGAGGEPPRPHPTRLAITWAGHSTTIIEVDGARLLTDPVLGRRVAHLRRVVPRVPVGDVDAILISHAHHDHLDLPSLRRLPDAAPIVVPAGAGGIVRRAGFSRVVEVEPGDELAVAGVRIEATRAEHDAGRGLRKTGPRPVGYVVGDAVRTYFAGDTDLSDDMAELQGRIEVALLPVSGWGPRVPEGHLDPEGAARALQLIRPRTGIPIHWGTLRPFYRRTPYASDEHAAERFQESARTGAPGVHVRILQPGERFTAE